MEQNASDPLYYLKSAPIPRAIAHMALPMMASLVLDLVYNLVDAYFVGQLNDTSALAALTLAFPLLIVFMAVAQVFGVGAGTLVPRLLGEDNANGARQASATAWWLMMGSGVVLAAVLLPFVDPIARVFGASGEALTPTRDFLTVCLWGAPFLVATVALAELVRSEGASKVSMAGMALSVAVNVVLDPIFLFGLNMGVAGAALATVLGNASAVVFFTWWLTRRSSVQSVSWADVRLTPGVVGPIFAVGSAALVFTGLMFVSSLIFNNAAMASGDAATAAFGIANRLTQIVEFLGQGLFAGIVPLVAYAYTAGLHGRLRAVVRSTLTAFLAVTLVVGTAMFLFRIPLLGLFSTDPEVLRVGTELLVAMLAASLFGGLAGMAADGFQAVGAAGPSHVLSLVRGLALIPLLLGGQALFGLEGVIWALPAAEVLGALAGGGLWLLHGRRLLATTAAEPAR